MLNVVVRRSDYSYPRLREDVFDILSTIDGGRIKSGTRLLVKPNLLAAASPDKGITTHPLVVKAACEYALQKGAMVLVADSPPLGKFEKIVSATGLSEALSGLPVRLEELTDPVPTMTGEKFRDVQFSRQALEADLILNLPKLKTHSQMRLTLAVKNLYGCVAGINKADWHLRVGENEELFAELIVSIYRALPPSIHLMDGILAIEGDGPGMGGVKRELGILLGSGNAPALDEAVCNAVGLKPHDLLTCRVAREMGLTEDFTLDGELPKVKHFDIPLSKGVVFGPDFLKGFLRERLTARPRCKDELCQMCDECINICKADALSARDSRLEFDYEKCIRCYCCLEICPHGALKRHEPLLSWVFKKLF